MRYGLNLKRQRARPWGATAFRAFVRRADDRRLERTAGSAPALKVIFRTMVGRFVPEAAGDFVGDIGYELRFTSGDVQVWTVSIGADGASARPGPGQPTLTVKASLADFVRLAVDELDAGSALLEGKLDLEGDFALATRLGEMFGRPSAF